MSAEVAQSDDLSTYKSPVRLLARFFQRSRDNWKRKYMEAKAQIKRHKVQAADARRSREQWKGKAETLEAETQRLEAETQRLEAELARQRRDADKKPRPR